MMFSPTITGVGVVTPLGSNLERTWQALIERRFIGTHAKVTPPQPEGGDDPRPRVTRLALAAAGEAIREAAWDAAELSSPRTALVIGTSKGPIEAWLAPPPIRMEDLPYVSAGEINPLGLHEVAASLARDLRLGQGPRLTVCAACASGLHALIRGVLMLQSGEADRVLVVAAEASIHPLFLGSFKRLGVLPPEGVACRPFDVNRAGFLMSEAAAAVCLEAGETSRGIVHVERFAIGSDSTHLTGGDPQGRSLRRMLTHVLDDKAADVVHAHGTGTQLNDPIELAAIEAAVPIALDRLTPVYSHKGALGHSLGAAGLLAVVLNVEMHRRQMVPPNVQTRSPLATRAVRVSAEALEQPIRRSIALAAGFGGPMGAVSLRST